MTHEAVASRRTFLTGLAALGATAILPGCKSATPAASVAGARPHRIDVHHHILPPRYMAAVASRRAGPAPEWTPARSVEEMDRSGIATAITSIIQPSVWLGDDAAARGLAREVNEYAARMTTDFPGRFGMFATVPVPDVEGSLREIEYALDVLKADGIGFMTSYGDKWLGDPGLTPVFEELNRRKAVVYTHPTTPACCARLVRGVPPSTIEFATDTTRTIASLLFSGTATRFRDVRFIFSHGGGTMPFLTGRFMRLAATTKEAATLLPNGPVPELRRFHYELAQAAHPMALAALLKLVPVSQVLLGTDFPFRPGAEVLEGLGQQGFNAADLRAIERANALALLPRLNV